MNIQQWCKRVLEPLKQGKSIEKMNGDVALFTADTDRTQAYVFESLRLPEIRGASRLLDDLNTQIADLVKERFHEDCIIYAGGGGLLAVMPCEAEQLDTLRADVEALYPRKTGGATITADWRTIPISKVIAGYPDGGFGGLVEWASGWLRRRKQDKAPGPFYESLPHTVRCQSCQIRPADPYTSYSDRPMCPICRDKRRYLGRRSWFQVYQNWLDEPDHAELHAMYYDARKPFEPFPNRYALSQDNDQPQQIPQDLSEIGQASQAKPGYVGMIHLDGDDLGDLLFKLETMQDFSDFSTGIEQATKHAVMTALATYLRPADVIPSQARAEIGQDFAPGERVSIHPFEIITVGGDDVWLIVPGDVAIPIAAAIAQSFVQAGLRRPDSIRPCTMSGGVVIADDHNPVRILREVVKDLARQAKSVRKAACEGPGSDKGYIDFHIFKSADMLDRKLSKLRKHYTYVVPDMASGMAKSLRLLARPYPADTLLDLWLALDNLRAVNFPPSQMHLLAETLLRGRAKSTLFYAYQRVRDAKGHYSALERVLSKLQDVTAKDPLPWQHLEKDPDYSYRTALWDIAELYDFVTGISRKEVSDDHN